MLRLDTPPQPGDWDELSTSEPAEDGFFWRDMLTEQEINASYAYTEEVMRMLGTVSGAPARLQEIGELLLIGTVREAMSLAVCVLRLEENGLLVRAPGGKGFKAVG
ncbi:hypothetical protein AB0C52_13080 [Streptomyces sp. NPDC048717]|uniref:hypothetical protein n=1 Tax=Streptomyces sp. NPDC048717 TaxID=3154928 RepID=UPI003423AEAA